MAIPLLEAGYSVELVVRSRILRNYVNQDIGDRVREILREQGAKIHDGCVVEEVKRNGKTLHSGIDILIALGVEPATAFLEGSGLEVNLGMLLYQTAPQAQRSL